MLFYGLAIVPLLLCNGVEWSKDKTQAAESLNKVETTAGVWQQSRFTCSAARSSADSEIK